MARDPRRGPLTKSLRAHHDCVSAVCVNVAHISIEVLESGVCITDRVDLGFKARQCQVEVLLDADMLRPTNHRVDELLASLDRCDTWPRLLQEPTRCWHLPDLPSPTFTGLHTADMLLELYVYTREVVNLYSIFSLACWGR